MPLIMSIVARSAATELRAADERSRERTRNRSFGRWLVYKKLWMLMAVSCFVSSRAMADSVSIAYTALHLTGSQWEYSYKLSGSLSLGDDIAVYFPFTSSSGLTDLATGGPDWTTLVFASDPSLPADGEYDMLANVNSPTLAPTFSTTFLYTGTGTPGSQAFTLFDAYFNVLQTGSTQSTITSTVPEPSTIVLLSSGMAMLWDSRRRRFRSRS